MSVGLKLGRMPSADSVKAAHIGYLLLGMLRVLLWKGHIPYYSNVYCHCQYIARTCFSFGFEGAWFGIPEGL